MAGLAMTHQPEVLFTQIRRRQRTTQALRRFIERFIGQHEGAPVHGDRMTRMQVLVDLHGFVGIGMHDLHEPAWRVSAYRQGGEIDRSQARVNVLEVGRVASVTGEEETETRMIDTPATP